MPETSLVFFSFCFSSRNFFTLWQCFSSILILLINCVLFKLFQVFNKGYILHHASSLDQHCSSRQFFYENKIT